MPLKTTLPRQDCRQCDHRTSRLFCNFAAPALAEYDSIGQLLTIPRGATLFREGCIADRVFVLCSGRVKLSCLSVGGKTMNLRIALAGDVLGLSAVLSGTSFEVSAETLESTAFKVIRQKEFLLFLAHQGEGSLHAATSLAAEYKAAFAEARRFALAESVAGRLAGLFLDWGRAESCGRPDMRFTMALTHDELANFTATTRETITRSIKKFQVEKLIAIHGSSIHILRPEQLGELCA
jgi:CRP/FNR family cyclic AMP-dependent transcriptional regulator